MTKINAANLKNPNIWFAKISKFDFASQLSRQKMKFLKISLPCLSVFVTKYSHAKNQ